MNRSRIRRLLGATTAAVLTLAALGVIPAAAATPNWNASFVSLPTAVRAGNDAGWEITVSNGGPSQINALQATIRVEGDGAPVYWSPMPISTGGSASCEPTASSLVCQIGTLVDKASATITVAFKVTDSPGSQFTVFVDLLAGTGNTGADKPGKSRGDDQTFPWHTAVVSNQNFDGGFVVGDDVYETTGNLGRNNKQKSSVDVADSLIPVTVQDGPTVTGDCGSLDCSELIGEWTAIDIPGHDGLMKVTLFIWGGAVPGGVSASDIYVIHDPDAGASYAISTACSPATGTPDNAECLTVTKIGNSWKIEVWIQDNGSLRGGI